MATSDRLVSYEAARRELWGYLFGCSALLVVIALLPKDASDRFLRLGLSLAFFTTLLTLVWSFTEPFGRFLNARTSLRFRDASPALARTAKLYVHALASYVRTLAHIVMAFIAISMARVLAAWPEFSVLQPLESMVTVAWWLNLIAVPGYLIVFAPRLTELRQRARSLSEQMATTDFSPLDAQAAREQEAARSGRPVEVLGPRRFRAGGFEWKWNDFYMNCVAFGQTGSGKTLCVLNSLVDGLLGSTAPGVDPYPAAGLILDPKGDFRGKIQALCARHGRAQDLLVVDPRRPERSIRWNPFDNSEDELELAERFGAVLETVKTRTEETSFWGDNARDFVRHAIELVRGSNPPSVPPSFADILELAGSDDRIGTRIILAQAIALHRSARRAGGLRQVAEMLQDPERVVATAEDSDHSQSGERADEFFAHLVRGGEQQWAADAEAVRRLVATLGARTSDLSLPAAERYPRYALDFFWDYWLPTARDAPATRAGIQMHISTMARPFLLKPYDELFGSRSTCSISDILDQGKILYVDMPVADREAMSRVICTFIKLEFQRQVLQRQRLKKRRPSFFLCDEFQSFFTAGSGRGDADFFERSRQSNHANVVATQNMQALLKQVVDEKPVLNLLGNCGIKIFLRNTERLTNEYGSKLFGQALETVLDTYRSGGGIGVRSALETARGESTSTQYRPVVREEDFVQLAQPSEDGADYAESIVQVATREAVSRERLKWTVNPIGSG